MVFVKPLTSLSKALCKFFFLDYFRMNGNNKDINAIDELWSRFGKPQRETGNCLNFSISYCEYIHKVGNEG